MMKYIATIIHILLIIGNTIIIGIAAFCVIVPILLVLYLILSGEFS